MRKKFKKRRKIDRSIFLFCVVIAAVICLFYVLHKANEVVMPPLLAQAEMEGRRITSIVINSAVTNEVIQKVDSDNLIEITKNADGEIQLVDFNPVILNQILSLTVKNIQEDLREIEKGNITDIIPKDVLKIYDVSKISHGIIYEIPMGMLFQNSFLANLGPKIPVRLNLVGSVFSNVNTTVTQHGINNALMQVVIDVTVKVRVSIPFAWQDFQTTEKIPLAIKIINGKVPTYYSNGINTSSPLLSLPIE